MVPRPDPCFLDECERLGFVYGALRWRSRDGSRLYTWDGLHGEIEIFNSRGRHLGVVDAVTGMLTKPAVKGRKIDV
jgi:hypothetical protein